MTLFANDEELRSTSEIIRTALLCFFNHFTNFKKHLWSPLHYQVWSLVAWRASLLCDFETGLLTWQHRCPLNARHRV